MQWCQDLVPPAADGSSETSDLDRHGGVGEVADDLVKLLLGDTWVVEIVDPSDGRFGVPAMRTSQSERAEHHPWLSSLPISQASLPR